jgi:hypothetical protein
MKPNRRGNDHPTPAVPRPRARPVGRRSRTAAATQHLTALRSDLARVTFLLGSGDGEQLFGHDEGETLHGLGEN